MPEFNGCPADTDGDGVLDVSDACPTTPTAGFDADCDGCRDTLPGLVALVNDLEDVPASVQKALLRKVAATSHVLCDVGNTGYTVKKSPDLLNYISAQTGKKISQNMADVLMSYLINLMEQIQAGQDVCASPG